MAARCGFAVRCGLRHYAAGAPTMRAAVRFAWRSASSRRLLGARADRGWWASPARCAPGLPCRDVASGVERDALEACRQRGRHDEAIAQARRPSSSDGDSNGAIGARRCRSRRRAGGPPGQRDGSRRRGVPARGDRRIQRLVGMTDGHWREGRGAGAAIGGSPPEEDLPPATIERVERRDHRKMNWPDASGAVVRWSSDVVELPCPAAAPPRSPVPARHEDA